MLLIVDITEREQAEQQRQEFTANVSHELKTPLTSIAGYAEIIEAGIAKPTDVVPFAGKIRTEAQRLLSLIEDIIRLSQLDAGGEEIPFEPIELQPLCCTVRSRLQSKADRLGLKIECAGENATVSGQRRTLEQMVFNLADNALAYNRPNGSVTIETGTDSDGAPFVRVSDTGIGIAPADQKRVFERFYRVDKSHSKNDRRHRSRSVYRQARRGPARRGAHARQHPECRHQDHADVPEKQEITKKVYFHAGTAARGSAHESVCCANACARRPLFSKIFNERNRGACTSVWIL